MSEPGACSCERAWTGVWKLCCLPPLRARRKLPDNMPNMEGHLGKRVPRGGQSGIVSRVLAHGQR